MPKTYRSCEYCGVEYAKKEHYERHVRTHTREKPFDCARCSSKFSRNDTLQRHIRKCHPHEDSGDIATPSATDTSLPGVPRSQELLPSPGETDELSNPFYDNDHGLAVPSSLNDFEWQWDDSLNLDPTFSIDDLCSFNPGISDLNGATSWYTLLNSSGELHEPPAQRNLATLHRHAQERLQRTPQWVTHIAQPTHDLGLSTGPSRAQTPPATAEGEISRDALASSLILQQPAPNSPLPCARLLNRWIHAFTTRLWPVIPVIHLPTFQPARTHPLLLLSICSLGALADGSEQALYYAERLFEGVHKSILNSFTPGKALDKHALATLQAAVIGQTFSLLSGKAEHLLTAQAFHGTLFISTRKFCTSLYGFKSLPEMAPESVQAKDWKEWVNIQTIARLRTMAYIHNGEVAAITQQPAAHRTQPLNNPAAAHDDLFLAKTADDWVNLQRGRINSASQPPSVFSIIGTLACFIGEISHARCSPFDTMREGHVEEYQRSLHESFLKAAESFRADRVQRSTVLILWHSCFLLLLCDINLVEKVCGRDGNFMSDVETQELRTWTTTGSAKQCIAHAVLMCRLADEARVCDVPAIHVARSLWHAGLVLTVYSLLAPIHAPIDALPSTTAESWPGIQTLRQLDFLTAHDLQAIDDCATPSRCGLLAASVSTTLRYLGPWPVAAHYAKALDQVLNLID